MPKSPNYSEIEKLQKEAALESKRTDIKLQKMAEINRAESDKTDLKLQKLSESVQKLAAGNAELKESVQKLAAGNAELKESVQKLAAGNAELKESVQKTSDKVDRMAEINRAESDKTDLKLQKLSESVQKLAAGNAELKESVQKTSEINSAGSKKVDIIDEMYEDFITGLSTEEKFYQMFKANPVLGKISFDEVCKNIFILPNLEIDILLSNDTAAGICEVKTRLEKTDINKFFEKKTLPNFINCNYPYFNKLNYYVIFACETMDSDVLDETKKHDCFLISSDFKKDKVVIHQSSQH